jgi:hypothetical protein
MKRALTLLFFVLVTQISLANDQFLVNARSFKDAKDYKSAIKEYVNYIKSVKNEVKDLSDIYFEVANCYYFNNQNQKAEEVIKESILKYGVTKEQMMISNVLDKDLFNSIWNEVSKEYTALRLKFVKKHGLNENVDQIIVDSK